MCRSPELAPAVASGGVGARGGRGSAGPMGAAEGAVGGSAANAAAVRIGGAAEVQSARSSVTKALILSLLSGSYSFSNSSADCSYAFLDLRCSSARASSMSRLL